MKLGDIPVEQSGVDGVTVLGSKTQIVHVLMNLLMNSAHALKDKPLGRPPRITLECSARGPRLAITVGDNGTGIAAADCPGFSSRSSPPRAPEKGRGWD